MDPRDWLQAAAADAAAHGHEALGDLLTTLARSTAELRAADWNDDASGVGDGAPPDVPGAGTRPRAD